MARFLKNAFDQGEETRGGDSQPATAGEVGEEEEEQCFDGFYRFFLPGKLLQQQQLHIAQSKIYLFSIDRELPTDLSKATLHHIADDGH